MSDDTRTLTTESSDNHLPSTTPTTMGSVSIREHIRWGSEAASEPTSTLVLTSPRRYFVDVRILKSALDQSAGSASLARDQLDWAFGGTSASTKITRDDGSQVSHSSFSHWVDSRTKEPEKVVDEGDMLPGQDDTGTTLETGRMVNPATGTEMNYEELWRDEDPRPVPGQADCTVFQLHSDGDQKRGLFIQLGHHALGVLRIGDIFTGERWSWNSSLSKWERLFKAGDEQAHSLEGFLDEAGKHFHERDTVTTTSGEWVVVEASR